MGAKYHYSPPVQSTPSSNRHRPSRKPRANSSVTVRYERTRMKGDRGRVTHIQTHTHAQRDRERGSGIYYAWKEDGREPGDGEIEGIRVG